MMLDFLKLISDFGLQLAEDEKNLMREQFQFTLNPEFIDIEGLYNVYESIIKDKNLIEGETVEN